MNPARISVALATFNGERHLAEQLASIERQEAPPHELVVTDDGSSDATLSILEGYAERAAFPVRVFPNESRLGFVDNFLRAASLCTGDFIAWCDQDDFWHPAKLAAAGRLIASAPDLGVVVHSSVVADGELNPSRQRLPKIWRTGVCAPLRCDPWLTPPGFAQILSRRLFERVEPARRPTSFSRDEPMLHDEWSYFLGFAAGRVGLLARPLATYRRHQANTSGDPTPRLRQRGGEELERYTRSAERCREYASLLHDLGGEGASDAARLSRAAAFYRSWADVWQRRAAVYEADGVRRMARVGASLPGYLPRSRGGLGFLSLAKDTLSAVR